MPNANLGAQCPPNSEDLESSNYVMCLCTTHHPTNTKPKPFVSQLAFIVGCVRICLLGSSEAR